MITINCCVCGKEYQIGSNELNRLWCSVGCQYGEEEHSPTCGWYKDWHDCNCGAFDSAEQFAKDIAKMSEAEVKENVDKYFSCCFCDGMGECDFCIDGKDRGNKK